MERSSSKATSTRIPTGIRRILQRFHLSSETAPIPGKQLTSAIWLSSFLHKCLAFVEITALRCRVPLGFRRGPTMISQGLQRPPTNCCCVGGIRPRVETPATGLRLCWSCSVSGGLGLVSFGRCSSVVLLKDSAFFGRSDGVRQSWAYLAPKHLFFAVRHLSSRVPDSCLNVSCFSSGVMRVSNAAKAEAQEALLDYLHSTRSLLYTDAEHISKNSPEFLKFLLTKVEDDDEVSRTIRRFLRYNPINEFEPFFESLGLKTNEVHLLLPHGLFFLHDDRTLLENFHTLCNYGIPRSKIGKIYKEAPEIFRYDCGVLESKLAAYEELGLNTPTVIKLVSSCPMLLVGSVNMEFAWVFEKLKSLGFGHYWIRSCLSEKYTYYWDKMLHMMDFLTEMGCKEDEMKKLFKGHPWFLFNESGKKVYVVVSLLLKVGMKMDKILSLLLQYPQIVSQPFLKNLHRSIQFLSGIGMEPEDTARIVCSHPQVMGYLLNKKPEVVLASLNISGGRLCEIIKEDPNKLINLASKRKSKAMLATKDGVHLLEKTTFLLKLGFTENTEEMAAAHKQFRGRGDQLQERFNVLLNAGLDFHDAVSLVKEAPQILNQTVDVLEEKIDYLVNFAGYPLSYVIDFRTCLCYNIDKMKLRFSMVKWLRDKGIVKSTLAFSSVVASSEKRFEKYYVNVHPEGQKMWESLKRSCSQ